MNIKNQKVLLISGFVLILDQFIKWIVLQNMELYDSISVIGSFFRLTFVENPGMAFGIQFGDNKFFTVFAVIASLVILIYLFQMKSDQRIARLALAMIFGGALGNLTDRFIRGSVVDFLDFEFFDIHLSAFDFLFIHFPGYHMTRWPIFNVADMGVSIGMFVLMVFVLFEKEDDLKEQTDTESEMVQ